MSNEWVNGCTALLTWAIETDWTHMLLAWTGPIPETITHLGGGCCYGAGMRKWYMMVPGTGLAQRWQVGHELFLPQPSQGVGVTLPGPSVPNPWRVILRKVQDSVADGVFHHRIVAAQGVGAFRKGGPSNLGERQGFSSHPSFPDPRSLPLASGTPGLPTGLFSPCFTWFLCLNSGPP